MPALGGIGAGLATMMTYGFLLGLFLLVVMKSKDLGGRQILQALPCVRKTFGNTWS